MAAAAATPAFDYNQFAKDLRKQILSEVREELASQKETYAAASVPARKDTSAKKSATYTSEEEDDFDLTLENLFDEDEEDIFNGLDDDENEEDLFEAGSEIKTTGSVTDSDDLSEENDGLPDDFDFSLDDLFADEFEAEDTQSEETATSTDEDSDDDFDFSLLFSGDENASESVADSDGGDLDILSLLMEEAENYKTETRIKDVSDIVGEGEVAEISMEELAALVKMQREKRLAEEE